MRDKIKWLWRHYRNYRYLLAVLLLFTPIQAALQVTIPQLIRFTIDYVKTGEVPSNHTALWLDGT